MKNILIVIMLTLSLFFVTTTIAYAEGATIQQSQGQIQIEKKLHKSTTDKEISGVCGGLGEYFGIDPTFIRIGFAVAFFGFGVGGLLYVILMFVMPDGE
jgi:phage shock protein PspC (stress-responsive transcriptional regulator)